MSAKTGIEWTDSTWNPILGCSRVSEGCRHCYAEAIARRFGRQSDGSKKPTVYYGLTQIVNGAAVWTGKIVETRQLLQPLSWRKPRRVFVNSMSDLFHENVTDEQRDRIFAVMFAAPRHTFQVLTKRPRVMLDYFSEDNPRYTARKIVDAAHAMGIWDHVFDCDVYFPLTNVWLGVSVENQETADERIPLLLQTPADVRFISAEPLLGPIDLRALGGGSYDSLISTNEGLCPGLDWVICGGESGPRARSMRPDWARSLRDQCVAACVPFFFKQWGEWAPTTDAVVAAARGLALNDCMSHIGKKAAGALLDGREWRQFPGGRGMSR